MFNLFNRNKTIEPIFETLDVDIHNHMIPAVDDGSESLEMSAQCIQTMWQTGFRKIYITPHFNFPRYPNDEDDIQQRYQQLKNYLQEKNVPMQLLGIGGEYRIDDGFPPRIQNPRFLTIGPDNYHLLEISLHHHRMGFERTIYDFQMTNRQVILAHPERYLYLDLNSKKFETLKDQGVLFQCNILSLSGFYGKEAQKRALSLIERGWVEFLGTDLHNLAYAEALIQATKNRTLRHVLQHYTFQNRDLADTTRHKL